jgi:hypothetical protein
MQGFIVNIKDGKGEDRIVTFVTKDGIYTYYRFFGARHSILKVGHLVTFRVEGEGKNYMPHIRELRLIELDWILDNSKIKIWSSFVSLFFNHLKEREEVSDFYYNLLLNASKKWSKQNPKRVVCDSYMELLNFENRIKNFDNCYICNKKLENRVSLMRGFIKTDTSCIPSPQIDNIKMNKFFEIKRSLYFEDDEVEVLSDIVMSGF